ncbi:MAG: glycosyltransferase [Flavobacteriaceae bacterium]|nr:glycosyltransferase [Flavobacteriaceae bacterium]
MQVLQLINSLNSGGAEKLVSDLCIAYLKKGVQVELALLSGKRTVFMERLQENCPDLTIRHFGEPPGIYSPKHILRIRRAIAGYDVVHVHLFPSLYWAGFASILKNSTAKLVFTEHNTTNRRRNHPILKRIDKLVYRKYDRVITISDAVHTNLEHYLSQKKSTIRQINNGIDLIEIARALPYGKKELGFEETTKLILQVSSFTAQKNQKTLIQGLNHLPQHIHLILVGEGVLREEHERFVAELGLSKRVHFFGLRKDVPRLLKSVDFVVLSSNFEGLSLSCVEGLASGKPFLASNVPGLSEVVGGHGILFENGDFESLARSILHLIEDKALYQETVTSCLARAKAFDINKMVDGYLALYNEITSK